MHVVEREGQKFYFLVKDHFHQSPTGRLALSLFEMHRLMHEHAVGLAAKSVTRSGPWWFLVITLDVFSVSSLSPTFWIAGKPSAVGVSVDVVPTTPGFCRRHGGCGFAVCVAR
jgi:hypothetical protein